MTEIESKGSRGISRRTVARTAAWSIPAVAVVGAAPAYAVSGAAQFAFVSPTASTNAGTLGLVAPSTTWNAPVTNTGGTASAVTVTVTVSTLLSVNLLVNPPTIAGWSGSGALLGIGSFQWTFVSNAPVAAGATLAFGATNAAIGLVTTALTGATITWAIGTLPDPAPPAGDVTSFARSV